jgi:hypothetical protein
MESWGWNHRWHHWWPPTDIDNRPPNDIGWWLVGWDDDIPNWMEKMFQTNQDKLGKLLTSKSWVVAGSMLEERYICFLVEPCTSVDIRSWWWNHPISMLMVLQFLFYSHSGWDWHHIGWPKSHHILNYSKLVPVVPQLFRFLMANPPFFHAKNLQLLLMDQRWIDTSLL